MLKGILAISGKPGLYKMLSNTKNSIIVESLIDGKRMPAYATSRISSLEDISIFTEDGDVKLGDVFARIFAQNMEISPKSVSVTELNQAFLQIVPDYDTQRVYTSDIKKVFSWYNILKTEGIISAEAIEKMKASEAEDTDNTEGSEETEPAR